MIASNDLSKMIFILILLTLFIFFSCSTEEPITPTEQSPDIPPQSTFIMDFSEFPDTTSPELFGKILSPDTLQRTNWKWAAFHVSFWNTILTITLAVPVAAFGEAFNHQPVQQPDGSWLWSYSVFVGGAVHTAKLFGKAVGNGVEWRMLLTKQGFYEDFEWYAGFSNLPLTEGNWTLNKDPNDPVPFLYITWHRNAQQNTADIKYTNIIPQDPGNGSYIFYGITNDNPYNRFYDIFGQEENRIIDIEWNYENLFGRVMDPLRFGDPDWHCWNEQLFNIDCQ
jgi:hypothetical protein